MHAPLLALSLLIAALAGTAIAGPRTDAPPVSLSVSASWAETLLVK